MVECPALQQPVGRRPNNVGWNPSSATIDQRLADAHIKPLYYTRLNTNQLGDSADFAEGQSQREVARECDLAQTMQRSCGSVPRVDR